MNHDLPDLLSPPAVFARALQRLADLFARERQQDRDAARAARRRAAQKREENRK